MAIREKVTTRLGQSIKYIVGLKKTVTRLDQIINDYIETAAQLNTAVNILRASVDITLFPSVVGVSRYIQARKIAIRHAVAIIITVEQNAYRKIQKKKKIHTPSRAPAAYGNRKQF